MKPLLCNILSRLFFVFSRRSAAVIGAAGLYASSAWAADTLERGKYLVEALAACDNCHTPRSGQGYDVQARFSGGSQSFTGAGYTTRGGNITPDEASGIGEWSDAELKAAITAGRGRNGPLAPFMPSESYAALTTADLEAVTLFLRSMPPVTTPPSVAPDRRAEERRPPLPGAEGPFREDALVDRKMRGLYVASLARCMGCHSADVNDAPDHLNGLGAGGKIFRTPAGVAVASNITSHPEKGVGGWSADDLKRAITEGVSRDGRRLAPTMANLSKAHFSKMSAEDLDALILWLRTVPPKE